MTDTTTDINTIALIGVLLLGLGAIIWQIFRSERLSKAGNIKKS